jgi:serine/threonine protein kinase
MRVTNPGTPCLERDLDRERDREYEREKAGGRGRAAPVGAEEAGAIITLARREDPWATLAVGDHPLPPSLEHSIHRCSPQREDSRKRDSRSLGGVDSPPVGWCRPHPALPGLKERVEPDMLLMSLSWFIGPTKVDVDTVKAVSLVSHAWKGMMNSPSLWKSILSQAENGEFQWIRFLNMGKKAEGTEGTCFRCIDRVTGREMALKKARVYPDGEGVPYYMLRELTVLKSLGHHPNISVLRFVNLRHSKLRIIFDYIPRTLHDFIGRPDCPPFSPGVVRSLMRQLLQAVSHCHQQGVLHRNLKPKHLLVELPPGATTLDGAILKLSDFALVRITNYPHRMYTNEVVTLWYRPPEILLGKRCYSSAVDIWSVGCIFAEIVRGKSLFVGISEVDQIFQMFNKLGTPNCAGEQPWPDFEALPHHSALFPRWETPSIRKDVKGLDDLGFDALFRMLSLNPENRLSAPEALRHPYFSPNLSQTAFSKCAIEAALSLSPEPMAGFPKAATEEMVRFLSHLHLLEVTQVVQGDFLSGQAELRPNHRAMLVDWVVEVVDVFEMSRRTAFLATWYSDRYLALTNVPRKNFQLLGATCLHIASKCEDVSYIGIEDLALCADRVFEAKQILDMEEDVLNALGFRLVSVACSWLAALFPPFPLGSPVLPPLPSPQSGTLSLDFYNVALEMLPDIKLLLGGKVRFLGLYLLELSMQDYAFVHLRPSRVAAASLSLALWELGQLPWTPALDSIFKCSLADIDREIRMLHSCHRNSSSSNLQVINKRYMKPERGSVSLRSAPVVLSIDFNSFSN